MRKVVLRAKNAPDGPISPAALQEWRRNLGWTQATAAAWLGVKPRTYENWEQGYRTMRHPVAVWRLMEQKKAR